MWVCEECVRDFFFGYFSSTWVLHSVSFLFLLDLAVVQDDAFFLFELVLFSSHPHFCNWSIRVKSVKNAMFGFVSIFFDFCILYFVFCFSSLFSLFSHSDRSLVCLSICLGRRCTNVIWVTSYLPPIRCHAKLRCYFFNQIIILLLKQKTHTQSILYRLANKPCNSISVPRTFTHIALEER